MLWPARRPGARLAQIAAAAGHVVVDDAISAAGAGERSELPRERPWTGIGELIIRTHKWFFPVESVATNATAFPFGEISICPPMEELKNSPLGDAKDKRINSGSVLT